MTSRGKSINLFLMDGSPNGRMKCTLANWTGVFYKIPRTELDKCKERSDLKQSGVYFLFGKEDTGESNVYIGQAGIRKNGEGVLYRLNEHRRNPDKDYWNEAVVFTTSNNSFGPTEISYLENRFVNMAKDANRFDIKNGNEPNIGHLTEEKESELEEHIENAKILMGVFGYKIFEPLVSKAIQQSPAIVENEENETLKILYLKRPTKNDDAKGIQTTEGFVVLKGSIIAASSQSSLDDKIKKMREDSSIVEKSVVQKDILFGSPSAAAAFVAGSPTSGPTYWKDADGISLKDLENES